MDAGDGNVIIGPQACVNYNHSGNNLFCLGSRGNNLMTFNFGYDILVIGNGLGYTDVDGDLYVSGTIYEGQTPTGANSSTGSDDSSSTPGSGDSDQGTAYASGPAAEGNEDDSPIIDPEPNVPDPYSSDDDIRSTIDKYASS